MKRIISLILTAVFVFTLALPAFAAEDSEAPALLQAPVAGAQAPDEKAGVTEGGEDKVQPDEGKQFAEDIAKAANEETADESKKFNTEKAIKTALSAAKAKLAIEGVKSEVFDNAVVTKVKYDKNSGEYKIIIRAQRIYKYTCNVSVKSFLGSELGLPEDTTFEQQGKVSAFFGQFFEKVGYFFIRLFSQDGPKE